MRLVLISLFTLFMCSHSVAQKPKFYASLDANKIVAGSYFDIEFTLENAKGQNFKPPSFQGLELVAGPSSSSSTSIINGVVSSSKSYGYSLRAKKPGNYIIGPATIKVGRNTLKSNPVKLQVVKGSNKPLSENEELFVKVEITDSISYVGQQLILDYKLYTIYDVRQFNFLTEDNYDGFYVEQLSRGRENYQREVVNGKEYYTKSMRKIALFPQQTGTYAIKPQNINVGIATKGNNRSFFFSSQLIQKKISAPGLSIQVKNTPPSDASFTGAVGRYRLKVNPTKRSITTDDAITIILQITGNGDNKTVQAPMFELEDGLEMYDPNVIEDEVFPNKNQISHRKTFEYLIVAKKPGRYNITPKFTYFDTDSTKYITLQQRLPSINVLKGTGDPVIIDEKEELELAGLLETTHLKTTKKSLYHSFLHLGMILLPLFSMIGIFLYSIHLEKSGKRDPQLIKKGRAYAVALERLKNAEKAMQVDNSKLFHEEIITALKVYLNDKHDIPALHLKKPEIISRFGSKDMPENLKDTLELIISESEMAMYAGSQSTPLQSSYQRTLEWIKNVEELNEV